MSLPTEFNNQKRNKNKTFGLYPSVSQQSLRTEAESRRNLMTAHLRSESCQEDLGFKFVNKMEPSLLGMEINRVLGDFDSLSKHLSQSVINHDTENHIVSDMLLGVQVSESNESETLEYIFSAVSIKHFDKMSPL